METNESQDTTTAGSQESKELRALKEQVALMEERQKLAKLEQTTSLDLINAKMELAKQILPAGTEKPLEGKTEMDANFTEIAGQVAYHALDNASVKITEALKTIPLETSANIMIVNTLDTASGDICLIDLETQLDYYATLLQGQTLVNQELMKERERVHGTDKVLFALPVLAIPALVAAAVNIAPAVLGALQLAPSALSFASEAAGYLRKNYTVKGATFTLSQESLVTAVSGKLKAVKWNVYLPGHCLLDYQQSSSGILKKIGDIRSASQKLRESEIHLSGKILQLTEHPDEKTKGWLEYATTACKSTDLIQLDTAAYLKSAAASEGSQVSKLGQAILREHIRTLNITHLLYLGVVSGGGGVISQQGGFAKSGTTSHIGGVVVNYELSTVRGEFVASGTVPCLCSLEYNLNGKGNHQMREIIFGKEA